MSGFFVPLNFGRVESVQLNCSATGVTNATGFVLTSEITVFQTIAVGGIALLPSGNEASAAKLSVYNRTTNIINIVTTSDQIENYGSSVSVAGPGQATFECGDAPLVNPKTWVLS